MNPYNTLILTSCFLLGLFSCQQTVEQTPQKTKEFVLLVDLIDDTTKIAEYETYHQQIWKEVKQGLLKAGFVDIRIYRFHNHLSMIIEIPEGKDLGELSALSAENNPKMAEWDALMSTYQIGVSGTAEGQTWAFAEKIFQFKESE